MQKFVSVSTPQTERRIPPRISAAVGWPKANSRPIASSQIVASLNAWRRGVGLGGSSGAPLRWRRP